MNRDEMLTLLKAVREPHVEYQGPCPAGFDLEVATADGAGTACWAWGSQEVEGPVRISKEVIDSINALDEDEEEEENEDLEDFDEDELQVYRAMVAAKCEPDVDYFHVLTSEDGEHFFSTEYEKVYAEWVGSAVMSAELTDWDDMEDEDLEEWVEKLDLTGPAVVDHSGTTPQE